MNNIVPTITLTGLKTTRSLLDTCMLEIVEPFMSGLMTLSTLTRLFDLKGIEIVRLREITMDMDIARDMRLTYDASELASDPMYGGFTLTEFLTIRIARDADGVIKYTVLSEEVQCHLVQRV